MPEALERKLKAEAHKRGYSKERTNAYVYGTLRKTGWTPSTQKKHKTHIPGASEHEVVEMGNSDEVYEIDFTEYGEDYRPMRFTKMDIEESTRIDNKEDSEKQPGEKEQKKF